MVPGQRFRFEQYVSALAGEGIELEVSSLFDVDTVRIIHTPGHTLRKVGALGRGLAVRLRDLAGLRRYDLAFVFREAYPLGPALLERAVRRLGIPYVFDFDDAIYLRNASAANRFVAPLKFPGRVAAIVRGAALTIAGNEHLARWAGAHNARVRIIPTTIDTDLYRPRPRQRADHRVCIGWSGSSTTVPHLRTIAPVLARLARDEGVRLRVIGDDRFRIPGVPVEAVPWRVETELEDLGELDIGVMPLPDDEWARGKCGLKALQYMALGIPAVLSPVGVDERIARGGAALLASSPEEWESTLRRLVHDPELRERIGSAGRRRVEEEYSLRANLPRYVEALREAAAIGGRAASSSR
jgi:glycosyltransferase involved in cell wall biosynthesis